MNKGNNDDHIDKVAGIDSEQFVIACEQSTGYSTYIVVIDTGCCTVEPIFLALKCDPNCRW